MPENKIIGPNAPLHQPVANTDNYGALPEQAAMNETTEPNTNNKKHTCADLLTSLFPTVLISIPFLFMCTSPEQRLYVKDNNSRYILSAIWLSLVSCLLGKYLNPHALSDLIEDFKESYCSTKRPNSSLDSPV